MESDVVWWHKRLISIEATLALGIKPPERVELFVSLTKSGSSIFLSERSSYCKRQDGHYLFSFLLLRLP